MRFLPAFVIFTVLTGSHCAAEDALPTKAVPDEKTRVSATLDIQITAEPGTTQYVLNVQLPRSIPGRQKVSAIKYSIKPTAVFEDEGSAYARFQADNPPPECRIGIDISAETYRYDFSTALQKKANRNPEKREALRHWLRAEKYLEANSPEILEIAQKLMGETDEEKLRACFDFVVATLKKSPFSGNERGALWALKHRGGDCSEFADLFVTLCRSKGIPARVCVGYLLEPVPDTPKHNWAEVYLREYGWIPFDPLYAKLGKNTTFAAVRPIYLLLGVERQNDLLKGENFFDYRYTGDPIKVKDAFRLNKVPPTKGK